MLPRLPLFCYKCAVTAKSLTFKNSLELNVCWGGTQTKKCLFWVFTKMWMKQINYTNDWCRGHILCFTNAKEHSQIWLVHLQSVRLRSGWLNPKSWSCFRRKWSFLREENWLMQLPPHFTLFSPVWRFIFSIYLLLLWLCCFRLDFFFPSVFSRLRCVFVSELSCLKNSDHPYILRCRPIF